jgi:pleiotropic regulator 1
MEDVNKNDVPGPNKESVPESNEEVKEFEIIPEPKTMKELIVDSLVSSMNFFVKDINKKISDSEQISSYRLKLKINDEYKDTLENLENLRPNKYGDIPLFRQETLLKKKTEREYTESENTIPKAIEKLDNSAIMKIEDSLELEKKNEFLNKIPEKYKIDTSDQKNDNLVLSLYKNQTHVAFRKNKMIYPEWHPPWKLYRVISGHTGWVRCIDVDPTNNWFVTGSNDKMIKFWDLASGKLKLSLTGHINSVRGVVVSPRHPYLFSCGEDKEVKCWDLEQNKVVRHYHGHLSGIYSIALHPTLDVIVTGGRDCVGRVWDIRSREQIFCLEGHTNTIASVVCQEFNPQIITGSHDSTVKLWDMRMGKCLNTLTYHKKSVRSLITHHDEYTFLSGKK